MTLHGAARPMSHMGAESKKAKQVDHRVRAPSGGCEVNGAPLQALASQSMLEERP
jgi:hypothetical protein